MAGITNAIEAILLTQEVEIRSVFTRCESGKIWAPPDGVIELGPDEWIVNVETVPPNPAIGAGRRTWIARLRG